MIRIKEHLSCVLITLVVLAHGTQLCGQTAPVPSVGQEATARRILKEQGVDEAELRERLLSKGVDVDNMTSTELVRVRPIIEKTIAEIKAENADLTEEKDLQNQLIVDKLSGVPEYANESSDSSNAERSGDENASVEEVRAEAVIDEQNEAFEEYPVFVYGQELFRGKSLSVFRATDQAKAPETYILDSGDELAVSIFGESQVDFLLTIGDDGFIRPSNIQRIYLRGRTLADARELVRSRFSQFYVFGRGQFSLTLDAARTISVSIYGEVQQSGTYTLSALNGPLNALIAAGGPTARGTMRNIALTRGGDKIAIDVYEFLESPGASAAVALRDGDIINVPLANEIVRIEGGVRRPLSYELLPDEDLRQLIEYAGGTTAKAAVSATRIERYTNGLLQVVDVNPENFEGYEVLDGDRVEIPEVTDPIEDYVSVAGEVVIDGRFGYREGMTVHDLLQRARLKPSARRDVAFVRQRNNDGTLRLDRISIGDRSPDLLRNLRRGDIVNVLSSTRFVDIAEIVVQGAVRDSFVTLPYPYDGKLTLEEAVLLAGGLQEDAAEELLVIRTPPNNRTERNYLRVSHAEAESFVLEPDDQVTAYARERFTDDPEVGISGAVRNPTRVRYDTTLSMQDLLYLAGGVRYDAADERVEIYRLSLVGDETKTLVESTSVTAIERGEASDIQLAPYDEVIVRSSAQFSGIEFVEIRGEVRYPGRYARLENGNKVSDLIDRAGGLNEDAFPDGATLYREGDNVGYVVLELDDILLDNSAPENMILLDGDVISVPKKVGLITLYTAGTNAARFGMDSLNRDGTIQVAYQGDKDAKWYVEKFAGGFDEERAKRSETTVTSAAGAVRETRGALGIRDYPKVKPGSSIRVGLRPLEPPKPPRSRERASWSEIAQVVVAGMTTVATLILINRAN